MKNKKLLLTLIFAFCLTGYAQPKFDIVRFVKDFAAVYIQDWIALAAHESGHAALNVALFKGGKFDIHLGAKTGVHINPFADEDSPIESKIQHHFRMFYLHFF